MECTENTTRLLQRALNALARGTRLLPLTLDGRPGRRTRARLVRHLAAGGREGEAWLVGAIRALQAGHGQCEHWEHWRPS